MTTVLNDDMQLFKQFTDNEGFQRWLTDTVFGMTYAPPPAKNQTTGPGLTALLPTGVQEQPMPLSVHDELRELNHATIFATCCSSRILCLFRTRRVEPFAAVAGPCLPHPHPGEPRATMCGLLLVQDSQHQTAEARA